MARNGPRSPPKYTTASHHLGTYPPQKGTNDSHQTANDSCEDDNGLTVVSRDPIDGVC